MKKNTFSQNETKNFDFDAIKIKVASPEEILGWSHGEITKPETINYRTQKPERDGLFDERIFGPIKDWECYCGKYKKIRYKGVICDRCGVEVTRSAVRRERMGHIDLASPATHIWYLRGVPSILSLVLDVPVNELEKVVYFATYIILEVNEELKKEAMAQLELEYKAMMQNPNKDTDIIAIEEAYRQAKSELNGLQARRILTEGHYHGLSLKYGQIVRVGIGADAILELLKKIDLKKDINDLTAGLETTALGQKRKTLKRLRLFVDMEKAGIQPSSLILARIPVIPPDLRPMVQLDGGRFATSDLNDLYRRVINRNNRLKKLLNQGAPEVICRNEKRMLQEAVDALIDNSNRRTRVVTTGAGRPLRSLSDLLRGKQGRFRQNLLGKRVDYSGRSVIVVGPKLKLHQTGIPKVIALELFKPFVISKLLEKGFVHNVKNASRMVEKGTPEVWDILEKITKDAYVLLNRAPTLHRLGIQAFQPVLVEGKAIQVHPLVCLAFNADFDGDQMAVHLPLSRQACNEASEIMRSSHNLLKPSSGEPVVSPRLDIVFGTFWLTSFQPGTKGENKVFASKNEAILAFQMDYVHPRAKIKVRMHAQAASTTEELVETSVGRLLFNNLLPKELRFINEAMDAKRLKKIVKNSFERFGLKETAELVDRIKESGFEQATNSGMTIAVEDICIPREKNAIVAKADKVVEEIEKQYRRGLITEGERSIKTIELWMQTKNEIEKNMIADFNRQSPVFLMNTSGARGSLMQLTQMAGMKGLTVNPVGKIIEIPIKSNYREGLSELEYFISTHGARKGRSDTALRTSDAGYLTRRLVDVSQDNVIIEEDCHTAEGLLLTDIESKERGESFVSRLDGRISFKDVIDPKTKKVIVKKNEEITEEIAEKIVKASVTDVFVRSVMFCRTTQGVCQRCYGHDLATGELVKIGEAVGVMAAQAIGEPGTQLTLKTFHMGGVSGEDITSGLPRVEELFEARMPRTPSVISEIDGKVEIGKDNGQKFIKVVSSDTMEKVYILTAEYKPEIKNGDMVKSHQVLATCTGKKAFRAEFGGKVILEKNKITIQSLENVSRLHNIIPKTALKVKQGDKVLRGQEMTEGHMDLALGLKLKGINEVQKYIISGICEIYSSQGQTINEKHVEIILREMFSKAHIYDEGSSQYLSGQIIDKLTAIKLNDRFKKEGKKPIEFEEIVMGITRVALKTDSFLSAASFQETTSVLMNAAIKGAIDPLRGLKENVIIGKLIPAGTGFHK